ncbi:Cdc6/Cdc18 family protein [Natrinema ejinorense]|uniref:Orc1/cdc6 family replication initiation protein n=1 Tax=Natrinema ejinorense TaxID=373386 RepID=A0A2A5QPA3_9EURY|nr:Cdc6/Cdc18 family protein [Natrinema ejinorense]PCR88676.1 orc1/cdc6 family replication initiation protein [Natrinema ejinorense]
MITDYEVLQTDIQPDREVVTQRDGEIDHLTSVLKPITHGIAPNGAFIYGPSGAGKTCAVRCVIEELPRSVFINCLSSHARRSVLNRVLEGLGAGSALERRSVSTDDLAAAIERAVDGPTVIVLDEADQLDEITVLHELYAIDDVTLILISNDPWPAFDLERFDKEATRLDSRIGALEDIKFAAYSDSELVSILEKRAQIGVEPGVVGTNELRYIARCADSDARDAIALLYHSVRNADHDGRDTVTKSIIGRSRGDADQDVIRSRLSDCSRDQRLALEAAADVGPATSSEIYDVYRDRADDPVTTRALRGWLPKFERYGFITKSGPAHEPKYEVSDVVLEELGIVT